MKAEHRKELETNTLADRMGQMVQSVKGSSRRTVMAYVLGAAILIVLAYVGWLWWSNPESSGQWRLFYDGAMPYIDHLEKNEPTTAAGKAARLQIAWLYYWDFGVKRSAADQQGAMLALKEALRKYQGLAEDCKDDKVLEPQAMLGMAVCAESLAVEARSHLKKATEHYEELVKKYPESAEGEFAQKRLDILKDEKKNRELAATYEQLQTLMRVPPPLLQLPPDHPKLDDLPKKKK